ncbi:hypothetical protein H0H87_002558 [Tephrocybe sp. NHM501043]|nr:hypothetical protein H0H87_002558 [Tephrocybe sp. NHM501043]
MKAPKSLRPAPPSKLWTSFPPGSSTMTAADNICRFFQTQNALRHHCFAYPLPARLQNNSSDILCMSIDKPVQLYDIRRQCSLSVPQPPLQYDTHSQNSASMRFPPKVSALPPALRYAKLDRKEVQRRRLVALFRIPQFLQVVKDGWSAALKAESLSNPVSRPSTQYI